VILSTELNAVTIYDENDWQNWLLFTNKTAKEVKMELRYYIQTILEGREDKFNIISFKTYLRDLGFKVEEVKKW
jgi:hypothetical protein